MVGGRVYGPGYQEGDAHMISHLRGLITDTGDGYVIIETGGIGFKVLMTGEDILRVSKEDGQARVFTHLAVREDAFTLYGFSEPYDLDVFLLLIGVNRIGPQMALSVLSQISGPELVNAIASEDEKRLTRLSGIGQRNAKRLILELKDRVAALQKIPSSSKTEKSLASREDAVEALVALGFNSRESYEAVDSVLRSNPIADTPSLLRSALAILKERRKV